MFTNDIERVKMLNSAHAINISNCPIHRTLAFNGLSDDDDILNEHNCLIGQINNVLFFFHDVNCTVRTMLLKAYCNSFYGCELWIILQLMIFVLHGGKVCVVLSIFRMMRTHTRCHC